MGNKRQNFNWDAIREEVVAGQLSLKEIARRFGCSDTAIRNKIKENGWERSLSERVREQVRNKLVREVCSDNTNSVNQATDEQIVEAAAERGAALVRTQRADIAKLRAMEQKLLAELGDDEKPPTKVHVSSYQGAVTQTVLGIAVTERAAALQALSTVQHKRIQLERQAFNLDEKGDGEDKGSPQDMSTADLMRIITDGRQ